MKKILIISGVVLAVFVAGYVGAIGVGLADNPMKVTDPSDPRFEIRNLRYEDYRYSNNPSQDVAKVLRMFIPKGSDRSYVEEILVGGGAVVIKGDKKNKYVQGERNPFLGTEINEILANFKADSFTYYHFTYKKAFIAITPSGGVTLTAYYDENNKLLLMIVGNEFVHDIPTFSAKED